MGVDVFSERKGPGLLKRSLPGEKDTDYESTKETHRDGYTARNEKKKESK